VPEKYNPFLMNRAYVGVILCEAGVIAALWAFSRVFA
jgi:hypothetical protein